MATLCRPTVCVPEHVITMEQTLDLCRSVHADHPQLDLALRLIRNTGVAKRHIVQPIEETLKHPGFESRNAVYEAEAKARVPAVVRQALEDAQLRAKDIDLIIYVSCTGFMMPSLTAWMINALGFRTDTRQLPIAQLGCAAGGAAVNRAHDFCLAYPEANVLIVSCELCSLCYQPSDLEVGNLLSNGLFGDGVGAAVVRGRGGTGMQLHRNSSYIIPRRRTGSCTTSGPPDSTSSSTGGSRGPWNRSLRPSRTWPRPMGGTPPRWISTSSTQVGRASWTTSASTSVWHPRHSASVGPH